MGKRPPRIDQLAVWFNTPMTEFDQDEVALCIHDPDKWFSSDEDDISDAKEICKICPLLAPCLEYAVDPRNRAVTDYGVWAGTTPAERDSLRRRRRRGVGRFGRGL